MRPSLRLAVRLAALVLLAQTPLIAAAQSERLIPISGVVTRASDDAPVQRAEVRLLDPDTEEVLADRIFTDIEGRFSADPDVVVGTEDEALVPTTFALLPVYPNPLGAASPLTLRYTSPQNERVEPEVELFDVLGRRVGGGALAAGLYVARLRLDDGTVTPPQRFVLATGGHVRLQVEQVASPPSNAAGTPGHAAASTTPSAPAGIRALSQYRGATVTLQVRRDGFVSEERPLDLTGTTTGLAVALQAAAAPVPSFTVSADPQAAAPVTFDAGASTGEGPLTYAWSFEIDALGATRRGGGEVVSQTFARGGTVTVTLTVASQFGATASTTQAITIGDLPAPTTRVPTVVRVTDTAGEPVEGARVEVVGAVGRAVTNALGEAVVPAFDVGVPRAVRVAESDYGVQTVPVTLPAGTSQGFVDVTLLRRASPRTLPNAELGGTMEGTDGAVVTLPVEGLVDATGTVAAGDVTVRMTPVDVSDAGARGGFPGRFEGVQPDGTAGVIASYGTVEFVFEQDGRALQLAPGKRATVEIPIYTGGAALGDEIALWSVDEETGIWVQEGVGTVVESDRTPTGLALRAEVTHFSWWNCDDFEDSNPETGLCWETRCSTGVCQRVAVGCWAQGGRNGNERVAAEGAAREEGPVFEVRTFIPPEGATLRFPVGEETLLAASALGENGELLAGQLAFTSAGEGFEIDLAPATPTRDAVSLAVPGQAEGSLEGTDIALYTFDGTAGESVTLSVERLSGGVGRFTLRDPDNLPLVGDAFTSNEASINALTLPKTGTYRVLVASDFAVGFRVSIGVTETEAYGDLPGSAAYALASTGSARGLTFEGAAGDQLTVNVARTTGSGQASYRVLSPSGLELANRPISSSASSQTEALVTLTETGTHTVFVQSTSGSSEGRAALVPVLPLAVGDDLQVDIPPYGVQHYAVSAAPGRVLHAVAGPPATGAFLFAQPRFVSDANERLPLGFVPSLAQGQSSTLVPAPETGRLFLRLPGAYVDEERGARLTLSAVDAPLTMPFSGLGGYDEAGRAALPSDVRVYRVDARAGDALVAALLADGEAPVDRDLALSLYALGTGTFWDPERRLNPLQGAIAQDDPSGVAEAQAFRLEASEPYVLFVYGDTGTYALRVDRASEQAAYRLDDDGADCADASVRSLKAAVTAAPEGAVIELCAGTYEEVLEPDVVAADVTVRGLGADGGGPPVIRTTRTSRYGVSGEAPGVTVEDLIVEVGDQNGRGVFLNPPATEAGPTVRRVRVVAAYEEGRRYPAGIDVTGRAPVVESNTVEGADQAIVVSRTTDALVTDNDVDGTIAAGGFGAENTGATIVSNRVTLDYPNDALSLRGGGFRVEDNVIEQRDASSSQLVTVTAEGEAESTSVVRGNTIVGVGDDLTLVQLGVGNAPAALVFEQNLVRSTADVGARLLLASPARTDGSGPLVVRNNVFDGASHFEGFFFSNLALWTAPFDFVNNTVRVAPDDRARTTSSLVTLQASGLPGPYRFALANNVFEGEGVANVFDFLDEGELDVDYNLFYNFGAVFERGASSTGANNLVGVDPLLTGDLLELGAGSPALDAGASAAAYAAVPDDDYDGTARPQGAGHDLGAHERE